MNLSQLQKILHKQIRNDYKKIRITKGINNQDVLYVQTPFCNFLGDSFVIYITRNTKNGYLTLDDDGETINNFTSLDINPFTNHRKAVIRKILKKYGVKLVDGDILSISGTVPSFSKMELNLTKAMAKIDNYLSNFVG